MIESLGVSLFDVAVLGLLLIGGLFGLITGFVRGGLFVVSWIGATLATLFGFPVVQPVARQYIPTPWMADLIGGAVLFLAALVILHVISHMISGWVRHSRLNVLDRSLGLLAGFATAALIIAAGYLPLSDTLGPPDQPAWLRDARTRPFVEIAALFVRDFVPEDISARTGIALERSRTGIDQLERTRRTFEQLNQAPPPPPPGPDDPGYTSRERGQLDRLIQGNQ